MTLLAFFFILALVASGYGVTFLLDVRLTFEERVLYGTVVGAMLVTVLGLVLSWWADLERSTVVVTSVLTLVAAAGAVRPRWTEARTEFGDFVTRLRLPVSHPRSPAPLAILTLIGALVTLRVMGAAYATTADAGLGVGHLSTFGDWSAHLGYAASFAEAQNFPPELPTAAGETFAYHFGVDFFSAMFMPLGLSVTDAMTASTGVLAIAFPGIMYCVTQRLTASRTTSIIAVLLFLLAGGMGAWDDLLQGDIADGFFDFGALLDLPKTYTFDGFQRQWVDNPVTGFLYPQRPTLIGFPATLIGFGLLWQFREDRRRADASPMPSLRTLVWLGVFIGIMPLFHVFAFGVLLVLAAWFVMLELPVLTRVAVLSSAFMVAVVAFADFVNLSDVGPVPGALVLIVAASLALATVATVADRPDWTVLFAAAVAIALLTWALPEKAGVIVGGGLVVCLGVAAAGVHERRWFQLLGPAVALGGPLVWWQLPEISALSEPSAQHRFWMLGQPVGEGGTTPFPADVFGFLDFWWVNTGVFIPLAAYATYRLLTREVHSTMATLLLPIWGLLLIPNIAIWHFWEGNNVKYVVFFLLLGSPLVAALLVDLVAQLRDRPPGTRIAATVGALCVVLSLTVSGGLDILRAASGEVTDRRTIVDANGQTQVVDGVTWPINYFTGGDLLLGDWVNENIEPDAVFVAAYNNAHPIRSLTGRPVVAGSQGRLRDLGVDWRLRSEETNQVLQGMPQYLDVIGKYGVDYVVIGGPELGAPHFASLEFWDATAPMIYNLGNYRIYDVRNL